MHDGVALQAGTSHYFGDGFARAFGIQYTDKNNTLQYVHQTSWGVTTRLIGAVIMVHGDDNGLVLPPAIAPIQAVIIPIAMHKPGVTEKAQELEAALKAAGIRVKCDLSEQSPGWKFSEYEMRGVPVRIEVGPRDIENGTCVVACRDNGEKTTVALDELANVVSGLMTTVRDRMYEKALARRNAMTYTATTQEELAEIVKDKQGFVKMMWCGDEACEDEIKEKYGVGTRCIPFEQEHISDKCVCCGKPAKHLVYWGKAY